MLPSMLSLCHYFKILRSIITNLSILVVNYLALSQWSTKHLLCDDPVLMSIVCLPIPQAVVLSFYTIATSTTPPLFGW